MIQIKTFKNLFWIQLSLTILLGYFILHFGFEGYILIQELPSFVFVLNIIYHLGLLFLVLLIFFSKNLRIARKNIFVKGLILAGYGIGIYFLSIPTGLVSDMPFTHYGASIVSFLGIILTLVILKRNEQEIYECEKCGKEFDSEDKAVKHELICKGKKNEI